MNLFHLRDLKQSESQSLFLRLLRRSRRRGWLRRAPRCRGGLDSGLGPRWSCSTSSKSLAAAPKSSFSVDFAEETPRKNHDFFHIFIYFHIFRLHLLSFLSFFESFFFEGPRRASWCRPRPPRAAPSRPSRARSYRRSWRSTRASKASL